MKQCACARYGTRLLTDEAHLEEHAVPVVWALYTEAARQLGFVGDVPGLGDRVVFRDMWSVWVDERRNAASCRPAANAVVPSTR